jgi:hypothetical protein
MNRADFLPKARQKLALTSPEDPDIWPQLRQAASCQLGFTDVLKLDRLLAKILATKTGGVESVLTLKLVIYPRRRRSICSPDCALPAPGIISLCRSMPMPMVRPFRS